ncbi:MAG: Ig-like domain-containing protein [Patescibacteria group bacterium]|nr:Ig-like domain-containing protein [Patescibacteria group bacterium]
MIKQFARIFTLIFFLSFVIGFMPAASVRAAGATLYLSPSSGTYSVGDVFNVNIVLNSGGGNGVNASDGNIKFDNDYLVVKSISKNNSVFSLWTAEPNFSNTAGTITYSGGAPAAYKGSSGVIISVNFAVLKAGSGGASFSSASALAADGQGTNILANTSGAQYTFKEKTPVVSKPTSTVPTTQPTQPTVGGALPPQPKIDSATHPDENIWYANNNPVFSWKLLPDVSAVSLSLDQSSSTDPGKKSDGIIETKTYSNVADGRNFLHLKFQNKAGWGPVATRQTLIDTKPPTDFAINIDNGGDPTNPTPKLSFVTVDVTSGIAKYKINLDGEIKEYAAPEYLKNPYQLPILKPGAHLLQIAVADQAGNTASSSKQFSVEPLKAPVITDMPATINQGAELAIQGTSFYPDATINIYISQDDKNIKTLQTKTDTDGNWTYFQHNELARGEYHVWAQVIDSRGAQSTESSRKGLLVQSPSLITAYGTWIILFLLLVIIFLICLMIYLKRQNRQRKDRAIRESQELEKRLNEIFAALKEEVNELMELADKKSGYSESEKRVRDKINEALDISQEFISKEIKDVEKEIE